MYTNSFKQREFLIFLGIGRGRSCCTMCPMYPHQTVPSCITAIHNYILPGCQTKKNAEDKNLTILILNLKIC